MKYLDNFLDFDIIECKPNQLISINDIDELEFDIDISYQIEDKIKNIDETKPFEDLVNRVIADKKNNLDTISLEKEIDKLVYQLYGLTDDEIAVVEKSNTLMTDQ